MNRHFGRLAAAGGLLAALSVAEAAYAQKQGGVLKIYFFDSPASVSIHEETTAAGQGPVMGVFNNLVMYKQDVPQSGMQSIVPDLASEWSWDEDKTQLTFRLREGVKWHDGKPFTAKDVKCTWDLLAGKSSEKLRINPRKAWYRNLEEVAANGDLRGHLSPEAAAAGLYRACSPPAFRRSIRATFRRATCVSIRSAPARSNSSSSSQTSRSRSRRNLDYWKKGQPYLDGIEYQIIKNVSTGVLAFVSGKVDMTSPYFLQVPVVKDVKNQSPAGDLRAGPGKRQSQRDDEPRGTPFQQRRSAAGGGAQPRSQGLCRHPDPGQGRCRRGHAAAAGRRVGMPPEMLKTLPGYDPDVPKNRAEGRRIMEQLGYRPDKRLEIKVSTRNLAPYRDAAILLIDQLKEIYIDAELEPVDTVQWFPKVMRGDYTVGLNLTGNGVDDPDQTLYENFTCGAEGNYDRYCNPEVDKMVDRQSMEFDQKKRKELVWAIERKLAEDAARPILWHNRTGTCWQPYVKGYTPMVNSVYNGWRFEDVWLDR